jgi:hypothetical protein
MLLSKYSLDRNNINSSLFRTQYTPNFLIAEYYGLRNTIFWGSKDPASAWRMYTRRRYFQLDDSSPTRTRNVWAAVEAGIQILDNALGII